MHIDLIVTRHPSLVEYLKSVGLGDSKTCVTSHVTPDMVWDKVVCGVLPHSLSSLTRLFIEVPLNLPPGLRGTELTLEQVKKYAGDPKAYIVQRVKIE